MEYTFTDFCNLMRSKDDNVLIIYSLEEFDNYEYMFDGDSSWCYVGKRFIDKEEGERCIDNINKKLKQRQRLNEVLNSYRLAEAKIKITDSNKIYGIDIPAETVLKFVSFFIEESDYIKHGREAVIFNPELIALVNLYQIVHDIIGDCLYEDGYVVFLPNGSVFNYCVLDIKFKLIKGFAEKYYSSGTCISEEKLILKDNVLCFVKSKRYFEKGESEAYTQENLTERICCIGELIIEESLKSEALKSIGF